MPSTSTFTSAEKNIVKKVAPSSSGDKILSAGIARIYYAYPSSSWTYSGFEGAIVFGKGDTPSGETKFWFRLVTLSGKGEIKWECELYRDLDYRKEREWMGTWEGDDCWVGFVFADENEADDFYKKVNDRAKHAKKAKASSSSGTQKKKKGGIDKSMISAPQLDSFKHVSHMGFDSTKGFTTENIDPSWAKLLEQLGGMGISQKDIEKNETFIRDFVAQSGGLPPASPTKAKSKPPPPKSRGAPPPAPVSRATRRPVPPPAPVSRANRVPPPPVPHAQEEAEEKASVVESPPPPPPPPPPVRGSGPPPPPPPPPAPSGRTGGPPPPPPPPLPPSINKASGGGPPPPPPPPPPVNTSGGPPPPPPPPPPGGGGGGTVSQLPSQASGHGRNDLLASIRGAGGVGALKKVDTSATPPPRAAPVEEESSGGGADLAGALAAALKTRKGKLGDSDDEDSDDSEWE